MASTKNCTDFLAIQENHKHFNIPLDVKWKRLKKYKVKSFDVREFINADKTMLIVVSEDISGVLKVEKVLGEQEIDSFDGKNDLVLEVEKTKHSSLSELTHLEKTGDIVHLLQAINEYSMGFGYGEYDDTKGTLEEAMKQAYKGNHKNTEFDEHAYAFYHVTCERLGQDKNFFDEPVEKYTLALIKTFGIAFDGENAYAKLETFDELPGFEFLLCEYGGDWEHSVNVFLYFSGGKIKIYTPLGKGNHYLTERKCAIGSLEEYFTSPTVNELLEEEKLLDKDDSFEIQDKRFSFAKEEFKKHLLNNE